MRKIFAALAFFLLIQTPSAVAEPIACGGKDMMPELKSRAPDIFEEIERDAAKIINGRGLLWRIEAGGVAPSYLFGTIHFTDLRVHDFAPRVLHALDGSRAVVVESLAVFDNPLSSTSDAVSAMAQLPAGKTLDDILPRKVRDALKEALSARLMSYEVFKTMKPWMIMQLLAYPACELGSLVLDNPIVDREIGQRGRDAGKTLIGLETAVEQLEALDSVPMDAQIKMLHASAILSKQGDDMHETFVQLYRRGEIGTIDIFGRKVMGAAFHAESYEAFMTNLLDNRNLRMRDRALGEIRKGGAFIAVGAMHLPRENGLVELFRGAGFTVTRVEE